jgi:hypothetical protein
MSAEEERSKEIPRLGLLFDAGEITVLVVTGEDLSLQPINIIEMIIIDNIFL